MDKTKKVAIGVILFNQEEDEFSNLVESISASIEECNKNCKLDLDFYIKWNSKESFDVREYGKSHGITISVIPSNFNVGFGSAHNTMMKAAFAGGAELYGCVNPDGFFHPDLIYNIIRFAEGAHNIGLLEAIQFPREHPKQYDPYTGVTDWCSGACLFIPETTFRLVGGFDDNIFMYCEDIDLSWRVKAKGLKCYTCSDALFFHDVKESKSKTIRKMMLESARYIAYKWEASEFQQEMERILVSEKYYPESCYLPSIPSTKRSASSQNIQEWRQLLSFSIPRW